MEADGITDKILFRGARRRHKVEQDGNKNNLSPGASGNRGAWECTELSNEPVHTDTERNGNPDMDGSVQGVWNDRGQERRLEAGSPVPSIQQDISGRVPTYRNEIGEGQPIYELDRQGVE